MNPISLNPAALLAAGAIALSAGFGGGWLVNGWRLKAEIAELKAGHAAAQANRATDALNTLKADASAIHAAAEQLSTIESTLGPKIDALKKEIKNAPRLPPGCKPDPVRVRSLDAAIDAANAAAAGQ